MISSVRRYTFKLYPKPAQAAALERQAILLARLWNAALEQREIQWAHECQRKPKAERGGLSRFDQQRELKIIRADDPEYAAMSSSSLELVIAALDLAFKAFFRRAKNGGGAASGYPRYKSTARHASIPHRDHRHGWRLDRVGDNWRIYAKGIPGVIRARGKFPAAPTDIRTMELIKRDGAWWASIVVEMAARRRPGDTPIDVHFNLLDRFATVMSRDDGQEIIDAFPDLAMLDDSADAVKSQGDSRFKKFSNRWKKARQRAARKSAKQASHRREWLHRLTTKIVEQASDLLVIAPQISPTTRSARGSEAESGAAVAPVAKLNRHILSQAPALAMQMLEYKAEEAGIVFARIIPDEHVTSIGHDLPKVEKLRRRAGRKSKEIA